MFNCIVSKTFKKKFTSKQVHFYHIYLLPYTGIRIISNSFKGVVLWNWNCLYKIYIFIEFQHNFLNFIISQYKLRKKYVLGQNLTRITLFKIRHPNPLLRSKSYNRYQVTLERNVSLSIFLRVILRGSHLNNGPLKVLLVHFSCPWWTMTLTLHFKVTWFRMNF